MTITLNGEKRELTEVQSVRTLLNSVGLEGKPVVVEQNRMALLPREIESAIVNDGDVIEVVQITAGG